MEEKKILRNKMKALRNGLSYDEVLDLSREITENVVSHYDFGNAKNLLIYMHYGNEVRTDGIIGYAFMLKKHVFVPKVQDNRMDFYEIHDLKECIPGYRGIFEPPFDAVPFCFEGKEKEEILMVLPGLAFDERGKRLGYGGGFYDRFLREHPLCTKMGIGFEFQCVEEVPGDEWDVDVDMVVTEKRTGEYL